MRNLDKIRVFSEDKENIQLGSFAKAFPERFNTLKGEFFIPFSNSKKKLNVKKERKEGMKRIIPSIVLTLQ